MQTFLNREVIFSKVNLSEPQLNRYLDMQHESILTAIRYYRSSKRAVNSKHIFNKLVYSFMHGANTDYVDAYANATDSYADIAQGVGITTPLNENLPLNSEFYPSCTEYLVTSNAMRYAQAQSVTDDNWMDLRPVTVLYQPYQLMGTHYPGGFGMGSRLVVIAVDIPALAVMHLGWVKRNSLLPIELKESTEQFIGSYVLPSMLLSQYNTTLLNVVGDAVGAEAPDMYGAGPGLHITTYENKIYEGMFKLVRRLTDIDVSPEDKLVNLPTILGPEFNFINLVPDVDDSLTRANYLAVCLANIPYIYITCLLSSNYSQLTKYGNQYKKILRKVKNYNTVGRIRDRVLKFEIETKLDLIESLLS